ncbi:MGDG synthase family glycosyltransferase [Thermotalea metallivorans]|uniref:Processive diacylglycerol beta-glucosyltransferase n=1 Tax=Thermotalea metallivorans TaxID=520762 RepID=A0A140KZ70_9FIRM|nr:glycosyltransferase [Thermotalea metallivorans]KXG73595.1 Processive diacylglycerol beta-glucosyltransferase [Thermotalea metallivorans]
MNILFFTVSAGEGHNQVAKTVADKIKSIDSRHKVEIIDTFNYVHPNLHKIVFEAYIKSIKYIPTLYGFIYKRSEVTDNSIIDVSEFLNKIILSRKLSKLLADFQPDVIVCTHPFPAEALSVMKRKGRISTPLVTILTDYTIHPSWINKEIDFYIMPSENFIYEFQYWQIEPEKTRFFGIPIHEKFSVNPDRDQVCAKLKVDNTFTALIMGGGLGLGNITETLNYLFTYNIDIQIIAIAGKNEELYRYLSQINRKNLKVFGFVSNVDEFMSASDIIITKPGGITVTEALVKELPIIVTWNLPGQEERNMEFILNNGIGMVAASPNSLISCINLLKEDKERYAIMRQNMSRLKKPEAVRDIANFLLHLPCMEKSFIEPEKLIINK